MRSISLQYVDLTNFKSFLSGRVDLDRGPGLRMIFGTNRRGPRLGANGAGKSTFISDAPCFCLSGRSAGRRAHPGGKRASELITDLQKKMEVSTAWLIDGEPHMVTRSFPPERIWVDGAPADQATVDELMGLSRDRLLASVIFGQDRPLFIDLEVPKRGDLLDEVLVSSFWMRAANLASSRGTAAGVELQRIQREVSRLDGALAELPEEDALVLAIADFEAERGTKLLALRRERSSLDAAYRELRRELSNAQVDVDRERELNALRGDLRALHATLLSEEAVLRSEVDRLDADIEFFENTGQCPTCEQDIPEHFAEEHLRDFGRERDTKVHLWSETQGKRRDLDQQLAAAAAELRALSDKTGGRHRIALAATSKRGEVRSVDNRIQMVEAQENPHEVMLRTAAARRAELNQQLAAKHEEESALSRSIDQMDFWRAGFRRVRVFCLKRILGELEASTMLEVRSLGLVGWSVKYVGETETKSETVRLGVQAVVQSPEARRDFDAWSPGEGQRVRVASALGLSSLVQRYSGVLYDFEVWDEPSAWLSAEGIDDLFESLRERAHSRGKAIWVVDPRAGLGHGGFDDVWNVVKDDGGSRVEVAGEPRVASSNADMPIRRRA
jgi:hypothetical protein